jgi:hypothetical protein
MITERNELDNYFMRPQFIEGIGDVYPVSIIDYEKFYKLSRKYITQGITTLHNLYKVNKKANELDYFVDMGMKMDKEFQYLKSIQNYIPQNEDEKSKLNELKQLYNLYSSGEIIIYSINELESLFQLLLKKKVTFKFNPNEPQDYIFQINNENLFITRDNFREFRDIVIWQNLLYEIPTSKNKRINEDIQRTIKSQTKDSKGGDLCAMISAVGIERGLSDEEIFKYTYYRLRFDYEIITRKNYNVFMFMLRSQGCNEAKIIELSEEVNLRFNPYDMIVGQFKLNTLDEILQKK